MTIAFANRIFAIFNMILLSYFLKITFSIIINEGGAMGIGYLLLPYLILADLFFIPSTLDLFTKFKNNKSLLYLNIIVASLIFLYIFAILLN
ncbi:hypothetical protein HNQ03_001897 [Chryseobacterium sp. 16F]|uniref:Uncharacterized protein n=1 Tax=Frigoriflavimonas asaccharolytica TaxID=2735899 RepID=A0A8J8GA73_9FLAO|nr:hypothetical protein [Frigoriflavimonas asaccharolytica]